MGYSNVDPATCSTNTPTLPRRNKLTTFWWCSTSIKHRWIVSCLGRPIVWKDGPLATPDVVYSMPTLLNHTIIHTPHTSTQIQTAHYRSMTTAMSCACAVGQAGIAFPWPASAADKGKDWRIRPQHIASYFNNVVTWFAWLDDARPVTAKPGIGIISRMCYAVFIHEYW